MSTLSGTGRSLSRVSCQLRGLTTSRQLPRAPLPIELGDLTRLLYLEAVFVSSLRELSSSSS